MTDILKIICSFFILFCVIPIEKVFALKKAIVVVPRAIIYSDSSLTTAIGFVSNGRELTVGENKKYYGTIVPIIVSGRVAYIQVKDIKLQEMGEENVRAHRRYLGEHEVEGQTSALSQLRENNYLLLHYNLLPLGGEWDNLALESGNSTGGNAMGIIIGAQHRPPNKKLSFGAGFGIYTARNDELRMRILSLEVNVYYKILNFKIVSIEALAGIIFSADTRIQTSDYLEESIGNMYGTQLGLEGRFFSTTKFGLVAGIAIKNLQFINLKSIESYIPNTTIKVSRRLDKLSSAQLSVGVSYKF